MSEITQYSTVGLTLTSATQNPAYCAPTGTIITSEISAIYAENALGVNLWTIENLGTLTSTHVPTFNAGFYTGGYGVHVGDFYGFNASLAASAAIQNGTPSDTTALISGTTDGIDISGNGSIVNYGTIVGENKYGILIDRTGVVINGSSSDTTAIITGSVEALAVFGNDGSVLNFGTILANSQIAINMGDSSGATVVNGSSVDTTALIDGTGGGIALESGLVINWGTIVSSPLIPVSNYGVIFTGGSGTFINYGVVNGAGGVLATDGSTIVNAGTIEGSDTYDIAVRLYGDAHLIVDPGAVFSGSIIGVGDISSTPSASIELAVGTSEGTISGFGQQIAGIETISFDSGANWLIAGNSAGLATGQTIQGFSLGDTIILEGFTAETQSYVSGVGLELSNGTVTETISLQGNYPENAFSVSDVAAGTEITLCYLTGTNILTDTGEQRVENLRPGDRVFTRFNGFQEILWIGRQTYAPQFLSRAQSPVRFEINSLGAHSPAQPLYVSPGHSMLLNGQLILAKNLVNGINVTQKKSQEIVDYYAIELAKHDCVLANHSWGETFADGPGLRNQFHNAEEFRNNHPHYSEPDALSLCAPRPELGVELETALIPLLTQLDIQHGPLLGNVERADLEAVEGWAWDETNPYTPVLLEIRIDGRAVGQALACHYRDDLESAGLGRGYCHFLYIMPHGTEGNITIHRAVDGATVRRSDANASAA